MDKKDKKDCAQRVTDLIWTMRKNLRKLRELKDADPSLRSGYSTSPGSVLNAYREGDIGFDDAVGLLSPAAEVAVDTLPPGAYGFQDFQLEAWFRHEPPRFLGGFRPVVAKCGIYDGYVECDTPAALAYVHGWLEGRRSKC